MRSGQAKFMMSGSPAQMTVRKVADSVFKVALRYEINKNTLFDVLYLKNCSTRTENIKSSVYILNL